MSQDEEKLEDGETTEDDEFISGETGAGEPLVQDPYEMSKAGTGVFHPGANENLRRFIRMTLNEIKHEY